VAGIIHELGLGFPMKFIWEERAKTLITYRIFGSSFIASFPQYREASITAREFEPGERVEVDYAGDPIEWYEIKTGEITNPTCSSRGLASASYSSPGGGGYEKPQLAGLHRRMFEYYGGVKSRHGSDCLKNGVIKCHLYDPDLNEDYAYLAAHFSTAIGPGTGEENRRTRQFARGSSRS